MEPAAPLAGAAGAPWDTLLAGADVVWVNSPTADQRKKAEALLADPRLRAACPGCAPAPRDWPQACEALSLQAPVLPWYLSSLQQPTTQFGNYYSAVFFAASAAHALGVPFVVLSSGAERDFFRHYFPWVWRLFARLSPLPGGAPVSPAAAEAAASACAWCRTPFPHECAGAGAMWRELSGRFAALLGTALNLTSGPAGPAPVHWPAWARGAGPPATRRVAAHVRCGDALGQGGLEWGLLPFSAYRRVVRRGDRVDLISASARGSDAPFVGVCRRVVQELARLLHEHLLASPVSVFWDDDPGARDPGADLARLAAAEVVVCGPSSTFCLWGALAAAAAGARAHVVAGPLLAGGSRPPIGGVRWVAAPRLARGTNSTALLHFIQRN